MMEFNLRELLNKQNKSVYWLANETGIHYNNVSRIVKNRRKFLYFKKELLLKTRWSASFETSSVKQFIQTIQKKKLVFYQIPP